MALQASSKVKGITIEIGADTTKFGYEMSQIRKEATLISKDMRSVDEAMKLDPTNVGKAADKLKLLREQADNATKKVNTIKAAIDALNKEYQDKSSKEYTEQLQHLERQLESATREQEVANARLREFESSAGEAGTAAVSLGDMIKAHLTSQVILGGLQKLWDLAKGLARELIQAGKELFNFSKDAVDVAAQYEDALGYSQKVFGGYAETVQQWVKGNSEFLRINISDLQVYANNLGTAFSALGLKREDVVKFSEEILNLSADIRAATGKDIDEIVNALTRGFTSSTRNFRQFGLFISEADIKIQALKDGVVEYSGDQEELNRLMLAYTLAAADAEKAMEQYTEDSDQFREADEKASQAAEALNALLGEQEVTLTSAERATALYNLVMERLGFLIGQNEKESELYNSQLALLRTKFANLKLEIGSELLPVFTDLVTAFNDFLGSEEGKAMLESIVDQFEKWGKTVQEWVESGEMAQFFSDMGERIPQVVKDIGDFVDEIIELIPQIADLTEKLLSFFGIRTEAEEFRLATKESLRDVTDSINDLANTYTTDTETIRTAIAMFAEEHEITVKDIYDDWETYEPQIVEYLNNIKSSYSTELIGGAYEIINDFAQKNNLSLSDIYNNWELWRPQIIQSAQDLGDGYDQKFNDAWAYLNLFAERHGLSLGDVLEKWEIYEPQINEWYSTLSKDTEDMEVAVDNALGKMPQDTQKRINEFSSIDYTPMDSFREKVRGWAASIVGWFSDVKNLANNPDYITDSSLTTQSTPDWQYGEGAWNPYDPFRASGGAVKAGRMYRVNDDAGHRMEGFIPFTDGYVVNGNQMDRIVNNNNQRSVGSVNIYVNSYGTNVAEVADELGAAFENRLRISGAML